MALQQKIWWTFVYVLLYCGSVKPKFKTGPGYWLLWEACELQFPKFTDNFGAVSSNIPLKAVPFFVFYWNNMGKIGTLGLFETRKRWHVTVPANKILGQWARYIFWGQHLCGGTFQGIYKKNSFAGPGAVPWFESWSCMSQIQKFLLSPGSGGQGYKCIVG